jgi:hypothetical protein
MGEYEPDDSRNVTLSSDTAPGEPPRTGPREAQAREQARQAREAQGREEDDEAPRAGKAPDEGVQDQRPLEPPRGKPMRGQQQQSRQHEGREGADPATPQHGSKGSAKQGGYGSGRDAEGQSDKNMADDDMSDEAREHAAAIPGEASDRPDERLRADANPQVVAPPPD